jgi:hypothetical protein
MKMKIEIKTRMEIEFRMRMRVEMEYLVPRYFPCISLIALAQSIGSIKETNPKPLALFSCFVRIT